MKYKGIIFDLDGTLSDSVPCILKCSALVHQAMGIPWDEAEQRKSIGKPLYQCALEWAGEDRVEEYLQTSKSVNQKYLGDMVQPFEGIIELLHRLKAAGVKMCVATSRLKWGADLSCEKIGAAPYLIKIIGVEDTEKHKPDPEPALLALEVMGIAAADAVFVGDSPVDINCGKNAGMDSIGVGWGVTPAEKLLAENPAYFCRTVDDLAKVLLG